MSENLNPIFYTVIDSDGNIVRSSHTADPNFVPGVNQRLVKDQQPMWDPNYQELERITPVPDGQDYVEYRVTNVMEEDEVIANRHRHDRNDLLTETDWTQLEDVPLTSSEKTLWNTYRQSLRDITTQEGFPNNIIWPTKPE